MEFLNRLKEIRKDRQGAISLGGLMFVVLYVVFGLVMWPLMSGYIDNATNASHADYVGADSADLVGIIPVFYFLMLLAVPVVAVIIMLKQAE